MTPTIRHETPTDHEAVRHVNRLAFGRDDEAMIVDAMRTGGYSRVSLVAEVNGCVVGHVLFSDLPILTDGGTVAALSLAPMAVLPEFQRRGVGSALVREGLEACRAVGHRIVVVLGHPAFYPRFGFSARLAEPLSNPFHGGEAWMALELVPGVLSGVTGWVRYPPAFGAGVQVRPAYQPDRDEWVRMRTAFGRTAARVNTPTTWMSSSPPARSARRRRCCRGRRSSPSGLPVACAGSSRRRSAPSPRAARPGRWATSRAGSWSRT